MGVTLHLPKSSLVRHSLLLRITHMQAMSYRRNSVLGALISTVGGSHLIHQRPKCFYKKSVFGVKVTTLPTVLTPRSKPGLAAQNQ